MQNNKQIEYLMLMEAARILYERPDSDWQGSSFTPALPTLPYVVILMALNRAIPRSLENIEVAIWIGESEPIFRDSTLL